jgi:predicted TPR repeat methyltransferase
MFIKKFQTTKCINGCKIFNDDSNYLYWENRKVTNDEIDIVNFLNSVNKNTSLDILHIGIGNSFLASRLSNYKEINGITISQNEIKLASSKGIKNYHFFFLNKYKANSLNIFKNKKFDIIVDINIKSFSCCDKAFHNLFIQYSNLLKNNGYIISHKNGLKWSRVVKPTLAFSFKNFFYKRLKEFDGPINNILNISDCEILARENNLKLDLYNQNIVIFINDK